MLETVEQAIKALKEYRECNGLVDLAECADCLATWLEEMLRLAAVRDTKIADMFDEYRQEVCDEY
jgi:hypothetical protein